MFSTLHREHKYILVPPPQLVPLKRWGSACNNSQKNLKNTLQMLWKTVTIGSSESSMLPRIVFFLQRGSRTCDWLPPPVSEEMHCFYYALSEKAALPRAAASPQDPRLRLREVNASVCTVTPCVALPGVITANTAGWGVWHNVTLVAFSQQTEPSLDLWTEALGKIRHLLAAMHFLIDTPAQVRVHKPSD